MTAPRSSWEWEGRDVELDIHRRGIDLAETRVDLELRLAARKIKLVYAFERPTAPPRLRRLAWYVATSACIGAAAWACPAWAAGSVIGVLAALAVAREVPP